MNGKIDKTQARTEGEGAVRGRKDGAGKEGTAVCVCGTEKVLLGLRQGAERQEKESGNKKKRKKKTRQVAILRTTSDGLDVLLENPIVRVLWNVVFYIISGSKHKVL
jgi:hypothetical protein